MSDLFEEEALFYGFQRIFISDDNALSTYKYEDYRGISYIELYIPKPTDKRIEIVYFIGGNSGDKTKTLKNRTSYIINPSFEMKPHAGGSRASYDYFLSWDNCNRMYAHSPFDVHAANTNYWEVRADPSDGNTFIGMVTREDGSTESISQKLLNPLQMDSCYMFTIDVMVTEKYKSHVSTRAFLQNFTNPVSLKIFLANTSCEKETLIYTSRPITSKDWETLEITFTADDDFEYIIFAVDHLLSKEPKNGHVLLDNIDHFRKVDCNY